MFLLASGKWYCGVTGFKPTYDLLSMEGVLPLVPEMKQLRKDGISKRAIAKQLGVSRTSVIRLLRSRKRS